MFHKMYSMALLYHKVITVRCFYYFVHYMQYIYTTKSVLQHKIVTEYCKMVCFNRRLPFNKSKEINHGNRNNGGIL